MTPLDADRTLYRRCRDAGGWFNEPNATLLAVRGADRVRFLNGQLTNDITGLQPGTAIPACCLDARGRLNAIVSVRHFDEDTILLDAPAALRETLAARLDRYIIADDVELEDVSDQFVVFHAFGTGLEKQAASTTARVAASAARIGVDGLDWVVPAEKQAEFRSTVLGELAHANALVRDSIRVEHGLPEWGKELDERTLPPEAGLDRTAISYTKGCYIGQEVISRIKSIGHPSRTLQGFIFQGDPGTIREIPAAAGASIKDPKGRVVGNITSCSWSFALDTPLALGYLKWQLQVSTMIAFHPQGDSWTVTPVDLPCVTS